MCGPVVGAGCQAAPMTEPLSRPAASDAVESIGWRVLLGELSTSAPTSSIGGALRIAQLASEACGDAADAHLRADLRPDRVELSLSDRARGTITDADAQLARAVTTALADAGFHTDPALGTGRAVQALELAIDTMDFGRVKPFWRAALAFVDAPEPFDDAIVDPAGQLPAIWFQQMDEPREQRNRIHFDITVPHDEAPARVQAALDAGGVLVSDDAAKAFWVLADVEGNEVCVCTWQDRDAVE